jgi:DNA-binding CsgD family transcriptional regulator
VFVSSLRDQIAELLRDGRSVRQIAAELGCANNTVRYHRDRLGTNAPVRGVLVVNGAGSDAVAHVPTREAVADLLATGLTRAEVARQLKVSKATVSYHARRLGKPVDKRGARRYNWHAVQLFYDDGHSVRECILQFGFSTQSWHAAVKRGAIVPRPAAMPLAELCVVGVERARHHLKRRLIAAGALEDRCAGCDIREWRGSPLSLALHHVNGDGRDNRLENLQLLCPNCHSQTENFAGRKRGAREAA